MLQGVFYDTLSIVVYIASNGRMTCMYVCMCKGWVIKTGPCTATFSDLLDDM
jgi:hypothetical protein